MNYEFKINKKRCLRQSLIRFFLALGGISFFLFLLMSDKHKYAQIGVGGIVICFLTLLTSIKNIRVAFEEKPILSMTSQGIIENYNNFGFISFSEITDFYFLDKIIIINTTDMSSIQQRQSKYWQWFHKTYQKNEPYNITIPGFIFEDDPKESANTLRNALNDYQRQEIMANNN